MNRSSVLSKKKAPRTGLSWGRLLSMKAKLVFTGACRDGDDDHVVPCLPPILPFRGIAAV